MRRSRTESATRGFAVLSGLLLVAASFVRAESGSSSVSLDELMASFRAVPGLSADFREEKSVALLQEPMVSTGRVYFAPPSRLARHVTSEPRASLVLEGDTLRFGDASGAETVDLGSTPDARVFVDAFRAVLAGDRAALVRSFEVRVGARSGGWTIDLRPRDPRVRRLLASVTMAGRGVVLDGLVVTEASGDVARTRFTNVDPARRFARAELRRIFRIGGE